MNKHSPLKIRSGKTLYSANSYLTKAYLDTRSFHHELALASKLKFEITNHRSIGESCAQNMIQALGCKSEVNATDNRKKPQIPIPRRVFEDFVKVLDR